MKKKTKQIFFYLIKKSSDHSQRHCFCSSVLSESHRPGTYRYLCWITKTDRLWRRTMPELPGLKQKRWNARPRNRICWLLKYEGPVCKASIHTTNFLQGKQTTNIYEGHKVHLWDKMHIWLLVTYDEAKRQSKRCTVYILLLYCDVLPFVLYNINFCAVVSVWPSCLHQYFLLNKYTSTYLWNI